jgi:hypothetical protein
MEDFNKIKKYQTNVESFLNKYRVRLGSNYTHISMGTIFAGKFMLDKDAILEFNILYAEAIYHGVIFNIAEKHQELGPIIINIDLEVPIENYVENTRLYNNDMIFKIIDTYREVAKSYLDLEDKELVASLFEKEKPTEKKTLIKDGFHIIFHNITIHYKLRYLIRHLVIQKLSNDDMFKNFTKNINDIIDKAVDHSNCCLLPNSKKKDCYLYELKNIYDNDNNPIELTNILSNKSKLVKLYSLFNKRDEEHKSKLLKNITFENIEIEFEKIDNK